MRRPHLLFGALAMTFAVLPARAGTPTITTIAGPRPICCTDGIAYRDGFLYLDQAALDQILKVDLDTGTIATVASEADDSADEIVTPDDLWIDPSTGDIYQTEILTGGVRKIAPDGTRTRVVNGLSDDAAFPNAITGLRRPEQPLRLFVSLIQFEPARRSGVYEVDPLGVVPPRLVYGAVLDHDVYGSGLAAPEAFAFDAEGRELYVPEAYGGAVRAVDVDAHTARTVYAGGGENLISARFDLDGSLLVGDQTSGQVLRLDPHGAEDQTPALVAQLPPGIDGIAVAPDGRIYVSNFREGGADVVETDGSVRALFPRALDLPNGIVLLPDGRAAIGDLASLSTVDLATGAITRVKKFISDDYDIDVGVVSTGGCDVYGTGFFRGTLQWVDICHPSTPHVEVLARHTFVAPWDVAAGGGFLWLTDASGVVYRVSVEGRAAATATALPGVFANPTGILFVNGSVYVSESASGDVRVLDAATGLTKDVIPNLDGPEGLTLGPDGHVLVVEAGAGRLSRIEGHRKYTVVEGLPTEIRGVSVAPVLNYYSDLATTPDGHVLMTLPKTGSLIEISL